MHCDCIFLCRLATVLSRIDMHVEASQSRYSNLMSSLSLTFTLIYTEMYLFFHACLQLSS